MHRDPRLYLDDILEAIAWIFNVCKAFICEAFKGTAVVDYCKPLITMQMGASHSPEG